jgi:hypothetical protein
MLIVILYIDRYINILLVNSWRICHEQQVYNQFQLGFDIVTAISPWDIGTHGRPHILRVLWGDCVLENLSLVWHGRLMPELCSNGQCISAILIYTFQATSSVQLYRWSACWTSHVKGRR